MVTIEGKVVSPYTPKEIWDKSNDKSFKFNMRDIEGPEGTARYLLRTGGLKNEYLGACLDKIRWGSPTTVMYERSTLEMIDYILEWIKLNIEKLIWNPNPVPSDFKLPHINHEVCPRNPVHTKTFKDIGGRVKCAHREIKRFKPSYLDSYDTFDEYSKTTKTLFYENVPRNNKLHPDEEDEMGSLSTKEYNQELELWEEAQSKYQEELQKYEEEEATEEVLDVCGAIISESQVILPLEEILDRLNLEKLGPTVYCVGCGFRIDSLPPKDRSSCRIIESTRNDPLEQCNGHLIPPKITVHNFDGWYLSWMVQKWYEQVPSGKAPVYKHKPEEIEIIKMLSKAKVEYRFR